MSRDIRNTYPIFLLFLISFFSFPVNLCLLSLCVSIVGFAWDSLNAKNAIGTLCWWVTHGIIILASSIALHTCDSPAYLLHPAQESYLGISFLRRLLLSLTDSLPKTLVSGYSYHRASIKRYYIITFYLKKLDLFYNSFHLIIPSKIPNAILRTTDIRLIRSATQTPCKSRIILFPFRKKDSFSEYYWKRVFIPIIFLHFY